MIIEVILNMNTYSIPNYDKPITMYFESVNEMYNFINILDRTSNCTFDYIFKEVDVKDIGKLKT